MTRVNFQIQFLHCEDSDKWPYQPHAIRPGRVVRVYLKFLMARLYLFPPSTDRLHTPRTRRPYKIIDAIDKSYGKYQCVVPPPW